MRLTAILLTAFCLQVSATTWSQHIDFSGKDVPLEKVFQEVKKQTGVLFIYDPAVLRDAKAVTITADNMPLKDFLTFVFSDQSLDFSIRKTTVTVKRKMNSLSINELFTASAPPITGVVRGADGQPLVGATVKVKGKNILTITDKNGEFSLVVDEGEILIVSYIGFDTKEIKSTKSMSILLNLNSNVLDEAQIIAYGKTSKRLAASNIASIKSADIEKQPVNNPLLALNGRVPGLTITQNSGVPGAGIIVRIQGLNSISKGNDPFYVINGVPFTSQLLQNLGGIMGSSGGQGSSFNSQAGNPLSFINPSDIESITVLKDADATAIYGSRAANGAILITTKQGKSGKLTADITFQQGAGKTGSKLDLLNTKDYIQMRREAYQNDSLEFPGLSSTTSSVLNYDITRYDSSRYTDWQQELLGGTAQYSDIQAAITAGNAQTTYRVSSGYHRETTVFPGDFSDVKASAGFDLRSSSLNKKFSLKLTVNYLYDLNKLPTSDITAAALKLAPNAPMLFNSDGSLNWERIASGADSVSTWVNPIATLNNRYQGRTSNLIGNASLSYKFLQNLEFKTSIGYNLLSQRETTVSPLSALAPEQRPTKSRSARYAFNEINSWIIEPQLNYQLNAMFGKLDFLLGSTLQEASSAGLNLLGTGFNNDQVLSDPKSAVSLTTNSSIDSRYKYAAVFGRVNYNWSDKYILNLTGRRDGSSRFGRENQLHSFAAFGAAWLFNNEKFIKKGIPFLSYGKLRGSYGTTGNDQIGDYLFMNLYSPPTGIINPYQATSALVPNGLPSPFLQWENTRKLQAGIDLGFLNDRLLITSNYFNNRSSNQLLNYQLPIQSGFVSVINNFPAMIENTGWEFSLQYSSLEKSPVSWSGSFNMTLPKNKLVSFLGLATSTYGNDLIIGQPIGIFRLYTAAGVDKNTGLYQFLAADGAATATPAYTTDRTFIASFVPKYYGGFQNTFRFKSFTLDFLVQFVKQMGPDYSIGFQPGMFVSSSSLGNQPVWVLDQWHTKGSSGDIQRFSTSLFTNDAQSSSFSYSDASFLRLKNLSVSWLVNNEIIKRLGLKNLRIFMQGQNLFTLTSFKGLDPETRSINTLPILRMWTFGVQIGLK